MKKICQIILTTAFILSGCAPKRPPQQTAWTPLPEPIALLPLNNISNDLQGPLLIRYLLHRGLTLSGIAAIPIESTDDKLNKLGITDGGQVASVSPEALSKQLGTRGLLYGELADFNNMNIGVYSKRTVKVHLWFIDAQTGKKIWENTRGVKNTQIATSKEDAAAVLIEGYTRKILEMITNNPLREEAAEVVDALVYDLAAQHGRMAHAIAVKRKRHSPRPNQEKVKEEIQKWIRK